MRTLSRWGCVLLLGAAMCSVMQAQVVLPDRGRQPGLRENVFGLGVSGGPASGLGLSFRHHLPSPLSYQIVGGIVKANDRLSYDIGGEAQYDLVRGSAARFFVGGGMAYFYSGRSGNNQMNAPGRFGLGLGAEMSAGSEIHAQVELMFTYFSDGTVLPLPQIGFHYYFY